MPEDTNTDKERVERIAKDLIRYIAQYLAKDLIRYIEQCQKAEALHLEAPRQKIERQVLDCLWVIYHMNDEVKDPEGR